VALCRRRESIGVLETVRGGSEPYDCAVPADVVVPPLSAWPLALRITALALLAVCMLFGASAIADASGVDVFVPIAMAVWGASAAYAWGHGRLAFFLALVPVYYGLAFVVADQLDAPCSYRATTPAIDELGEVVRWWPPHPVCELRLVDGSRRYEGGLPPILLAPFLWACVASVLALVRRPRVGARAGLIAGTWLVAVWLAFV
jgi:hypothetical protein